MKSHITLLIFFLLGICAQNNVCAQQTQYTDLVNPLLGTAPLTDSAVIGYKPPKDWRVWAGLVFPGSSVPNAMVQLSPVTKYHTGSGYQYEDSVIYGFTHTSKGHWNLNNIPILPAYGKIDPNDFGSEFTHDQETAKPGFYEVYLKRYGINVKLTSTLRTGFHQYTFKEKKDKKVIVDLQKSNEEVRGWNIKQTGTNSLSGYQITSDTVFFYAVTNIPIKRIDSVINQKRIVPVINFKDSENSIVELRIGLSYVSVKNAKENLEEENLGKSFETIKSNANDSWNRLLGKIKISGGTEKQTCLFYSSLYRSFLWPALRSDVNGEYRNVKGKVVKGDFRYYTVPSLWDTYRNKLVLLGLVSPDVTRDVIKSLIDRGNLTGFIPTFFHGDHAAAFIAGSYLRGITDFDIKTAYKLLLRNATIEGGTRPYISEYISMGYISSPDVSTPVVETKGKAGVSKTLEYAFDDYAVANIAKALGDSINYIRFMKRSENYKNVFNKNNSFMQGRLANGTWVKNFNPQYPYYEYMYREANAWQVSFFAPHDMPGLIKLYGGTKKFEKRLDLFFNTPWNPSYIARNISCFIGQYCVGNQPDHEAPFSYYFVNKPEKSQKILDQIMNNFYGIGMSQLALPGMDDAGEMSAWYVFVSMGIYPYTSADDKFIVTVPLFKKVQWKSNNGAIFTILRTNDSRKIKGIKVNGKTNKSYFINSDLFRNGGNLQIGN